MTDLIATSAHVELFRATDDMPSRDTLLTLARNRATDPEAFDEEGVEPWFFMVDASNTRLDAHYTQMDVSTLNNFAQDAEAGVAILKSHDMREHYGSSLTGDVVKRGQDTIFRSVFFTVNTLAPEEIQKMRMGISKDVSVGFRIPPEGMIVCSICGGNMMDWSACSHWPGRNYEVEEKGKKVTKLATGRIVGGRLSEYSTVYDGSTPGAGVLKGLRMVEAGEMSPELAATLERTYNRSFPVHRSYAVPDIDTGVTPDESTREGETMSELFDKVRALLQDRNIRVRTGADEDAILDQLKGHLTDLDRDIQDHEGTISTQKEEIQRLEPLAEDGERYRDDVIERAIENYVRTLKPELRKSATTDHWRRAFKNMDIPDITKMSEEWEANAIFDPDRQSNELNGTKPDAKPRPNRQRRLAAAAHRD